MLGSAGAIGSAAAVGSTADSVVNKVYLTVAYCPTAFTGEGATVVLSDTAGSFNITNRFKLPEADTIGCPIQQDVTFIADPHVRPARRAGLRGRTVHWSWGDAWGALSLIDLDEGKVVHSAKGSTPDGSIFDGMTSFTVYDDSGKTNVGLSPHVTEDGFCHNGCFRLGHQDVMSGVFHGLPALPFKATQTSVAFHDKKLGIYYAQGSYPLTPDAHCGADESSQCLFAINSTTGELLSSKALRHGLAGNFQVYRYMDGPVAADGTVLAWGFGFQDTCGHNLNSFAFARVHLATATPTRIACADQSATVHMKPEMGAFSSDGTRFAFAAGDSVETGLRQLLVYETATGKLILNSDLKALPKALGVSSDAPFFAIWGLAHMPPPQAATTTASV